MPPRCNLFFLLIQNLLAFFVDMVLDIMGGDCLSQRSATRIIDCSHSLLSLVSASSMLWSGISPDCNSMGGGVSTATCGAIDLPCS